jgi:hypothetical protein
MPCLRQSTTARDTVKVERVRGYPNNTRVHKVSSSDDSTIATLAAQTETAPQIVREIYDDERARLRADATVPNFIDVIAGRRTKALLKNRKALPPSRNPSATLEPPTS